LTSDAPAEGVSHRRCVGQPWIVGRSERLMNPSVCTASGMVEE
jgi:hypothetical protein